MRKNWIYIAIFFIFIVCVLLYAIAEGIVFDSDFVSNNKSNLLVAAVTFLAAIGSLGAFFFLIWERCTNEDKIRLEKSVAHKQWFYSLLEDIENSVQHRFNFNKYKLYKVVYGSLRRQNYSEKIDDFDYVDNATSLKSIISKYEELYTIADGSINGLEKEFLFKAISILNDLGVTYTGKCKIGDVFHKQEDVINSKTTRYFNVLSIDHFFSDLEMIINELCLYAGVSRIGAIKLNNDQRNMLINYSVVLHNLRPYRVYYGIEMHYWRLVLNLFSKNKIPCDALKTCFNSPEDVWDLLILNGHNMQLDLFGILDEYKSRIEQEEYDRISIQINGLSKFFVKNEPVS